MWELALHASMWIWVTNIIESILSGISKLSWKLKYAIKNFLQGCLGSQQIHMDPSLKDSGL